MMTKLTVEAWCVESRPSVLRNRGLTTTLEVDQAMLKVLIRAAFNVLTAEEEKLVMADLVAHSKFSAEAAREALAHL